MKDNYNKTMAAVAVLMVICMISLCYGFYKLLFTSTTGQECAVTVQFKDSKATYIGKTV